MASAADDPRPAWTRLERAAAAAVAGLAAWRSRALDAEREVARLRAELGSLTGAAGGPGADAEVRRLRAENALLTSRAAEARQRVTALLARLAVLERRR
jgi:hypothetical protein